MAFKITLLSDVRSVLRGTSDVEKSLDDVADSLDDLATNTARASDDAGDALERSFRDALDKVKKETKDTSRKMGDDLKDGTREAGEGFDDLKDEAAGSAREAAASFSGEFDDVADYVQEVLAQALSGFGPIGAAAGLAAAAGIGILVAGLQDAAEKAEESKDRVLDLADAIADAGGNPSAIRWAEQLRDTMKQIVDTKEWYEFWQNSPVDKLTDWSRKAREFGVSMSDIMQAQAGNADAQRRVNETMDEFIAKNTEIRQVKDEYGNVTQELETGGEAARKFRDEMNAGAQEVQDAASWQRDYADATRDLGNAQADAAEASGQFSDTLTNNLSVADEGLDRFVRKGKLKIAEWTEELNRRAGQNTRIKDFTVDVDTKLSPEALNNFAKLPAETQDQIAKAYRSGSKKDRKRIVQNLEAEAKVDKISIDTSGAQTQAAKKPIEIPTTVAESGAVKGAQDAADSAQKVASRERNKIEFKTRVDDAGLQTAVNRAAAAIRPPTVWVNVKAKKEVP